MMVRPEMGAVMQGYSQADSYDSEFHRALTPGSGSTMVDVIDQSASARPYRAMLFCDGARLLYDDFARQSDALAAALVSLGIGRGDRVATLLPNSLQIVVALQGIWKAGAAVVPINPRLENQQITWILRLTGSRAVITSSGNYKGIKESAAGPMLETVITTDLGEYFPAQRRFFRRHTVPLERGDRLWQDLIKLYIKRGRPNVRAWPDDPALIFCSGQPTLALTIRTHLDLMLYAIQYYRWLSPILDQWDDRFMLATSLAEPVPLACIFGAAMINHSSCVLTADHSGSRDSVRQIKKFKPALICADAAFFTDLTGSGPDVSARWLDGIKIALSVGIGPDEDTKRRFESLTGSQLFKILT